MEYTYPSHKICLLWCYYYKLVFDIILGDSLFLDSDIIKFSHTDLMS